MPRTAASDLATRLVGREIRRVRIDAGLTQREVAERMETTDTYISNLEAGRLNLTLGQLARVAGALDTDLEVTFPKLSVRPTSVHEPAREQADGEESN